jgi:hypothetical protein
METNAADPQVLPPREKIRIFISYCHEDRAFAKRTATVLGSLGLLAIWDDKLSAGCRFRDELRDLISCAQVFLVLLTRESAARPWVLQETGYAAALNIPIVPVSITSPPEGLIGDLHAVRVHADWSDLEGQLSQVQWAKLRSVSDQGPQPVLATLARSPLDRTKLLGQYSRRVELLGKKGMVRQRAGFSSFSIPTEATMDDAWAQFDGKRPRPPDYHEQQREERLALELHAQSAGCKLIISPTLNVQIIGSDACIARLQNLRRFIDSLTGDQIQVVSRLRSFGPNVTILGDWWVAESLVPSPYGYANGTFTWHAGTVTRFAREFDEEFGTICKQKGIVPARSREIALQEIDRAIEEGRERAGTVGPAA